MNKNIFNNYLSSLCSVPYGGYLVLSVGKEGGSGCLKIYTPFFYIQCNEMKICLSDKSIACLWLSKHFECGQMPYLSLEYIKYINLIKRGLCTSKSIKNQAPSCGESKLFFALNIGKWYLKKNYEEKI